MFIKLVLLLALGVRTLSTPTTDPALEQRHHRHASALLASFELNDTTCSQPISYDPSLGTYDSSWTLSDNACVIFTTLGDVVGGSWGGIATIQMFMDPSCTKPQPGMVIARHGKESDYCVPMSVFGCGPSGPGGDSCLVNSVMAHRK